MQTVIGENGLVVDAAGISMAVSGVRNERVTPSGLEVFCFSLTGGVQRFGYGGRITQFENVDYVEREVKSRAFNELEERAYDIIALDLTGLKPEIVAAGVRDAIKLVIFARFNGLYNDRSAPIFSIAGNVDVTHFNKRYMEGYKKGEDDSAYGAYGFRFVKGSRRGNTFNLGL